LVVRHVAELKRRKCRRGISKRHLFASRTTCLTTNIADHVIKTFLLLMAFVLATVNIFADTSLSQKEVLQRIFEAAKRNDHNSERYGFWQESTMKKLSDEGSVKKQERRTYHTIWIENQPYGEL